MKRRRWGSPDGIASGCPPVVLGLLSDCSEKRSPQGELPLPVFVIAFLNGPMEATGPGRKEKTARPDQDGRGEGGRGGVKGRICGESEW